MRIANSYFTAVAIAFASLCVQGATTEQDQQGPMALAMKLVEDALAPVTSEYFAILDRKFKAADEMASRPTKSPVTARPFTPRPTQRPTSAKPTTSKPTRRPSQARPSRKPTAAPTPAPTSVPTQMPSMKEIQEPLTNEIQPTDMPTAIPRHGGRFWTLDPSSEPTPGPIVDQVYNSNHVSIYSLAPTDSPTSAVKQLSNTASTGPSEAPTEAPFETPKHGGIFWAFPTKKED